MPETVTTTSGPVAGRRDEQGRVFLGIPYAAPPFGELRLRPPQPHEPWSEPWDASKPGPTVPKRPYRKPFDELLPEPHIEGEECLNLNIWAPLEGERHPVLVWIHGGAFVNGSGIVPIYDGSAFARDGIVCVSINYRLGAEGFLYTGEGEANLGLRDQIAALEWVRDNIAAFGGDPARVTIAGESAGGMSVTALLSSPLAGGLFHRAISQSGAGHTGLSPETALVVARELAARLEIEPTREAFAGVDPDALAREVAALREELALNPDPAKWREAAAQGMALQPVIDGDVLPQLPIASIRGGAGAGVDVLVGSNRDEYRFFTVPLGVNDLVTDDVVEMMVVGFGYPADAVSLLREDGESAGDALNRLVTQWYFLIPAIRLAEAVGGNGSRAHLYEFTWPSPALEGGLGSCHALELSFVFDTLAAPEGHALSGANPPQQLADAMHRAWVGFITTGDPGWAAYDTDTRTTMVFDVTSGPVDDPHPQVRRAWDEANPPR